MKQILRKLLSRFAPDILTTVRIYNNQVRNRNSYLNVTGWTRSLAERTPYGPDGLVVPWMNYPVVALLKDRLNKEMRLFEYGSGYSTLFFSRFVGEVISLEYDEKWYEKISKEVPENAKVMFVKQDVDGDYCRAIHRIEGLFDVVVIDGRDRVNCMKQALTKLKSSGVMVLDDSNRARYMEGINHMVQNGFRQLQLEGLKPTEYGLDQTAIFYRNKNCLHL